MKIYARGLTCPLILCSALCFALSFYGFVLAPFFFLVPLFFLHLQKQLNFSKGFLWGCCFFLIHFYGFFLVIYRQGSGGLRIIWPFLLVLYCALYSGAWFSIMGHTTTSRRAKHYIFLLATLFYFWWCDTSLLWPFGVWQGYPLAFPLVGLMTCQWMASSVVVLGKWVTLALLILLQMWIVEFFLRGRLVFFFCIVPFLVGWFIPSSSSLPDWVDKTLFVPFIDQQEPLERAHELVSALATKQFELLLLPESFFPVALSEKSLIIRILKDIILDDRKSCFFGGHKSYNGNLYNCFFYFNQRRIILSYEKTHLIPFFEWNPYQENKIGTFFNFFLHKRKAFTHGSQEPTPVFCPVLGYFLPVVCSELFWKDRRSLTSKIPLVCLANDHYFAGSGYAHCMLLTAQFVALLERRSVVYCASSEAYFINDRGKIMRKINKI